MDPQQTWSDMLEALKQKRWQDAHELATALHEWIRKGGFPPTTIGAKSIGQNWHKTIATFTCLSVTVKEHPRYVWLNDSTSADGAQEYAVLKLGLAKGDMTQIETITFSWCDEPKALKFIQETLDGKDDDSEFARKVRAIIQQLDEHGDCLHCA